MGRVMVGAVLVAAGLLGGCATGAPDQVPVASAMPDAQRTVDAPSGFVSFCLRFASQCEASPGATDVVNLDTQSWRTLVAVNQSVNDAIWPEDDQRHYGRAEFWTIPSDGYGDCDDYAVTKRRDLMAAGFPGSALRLAVAVTADAKRHAVLTVATNHGDLVLDNLREDIVPWNSTGFRWIERQDASDPMRWVSLQPVYTAESGNTPTAEMPAPTGKLLAAN